MEIIPHDNLLSTVIDYIVTFICMSIGSLAAVFIMYCFWYAFLLGVWFVTLQMPPELFSEPNWTMIRGFYLFFMIFLTVIMIRHNNDRVI